MSQSSIIPIDDDLDDEGDERLTSKEFLNLIPHLPFQQILQVEVFLNNKWKPLVCKSDGTDKYCCTICNVYQIPKNMIAHIEGKKHGNVMKDVKDIFHPEYTYPKSTQNKQEKVNAKPPPSPPPKNICSPIQIEEIEINDEQIVEKEHSLSKNHDFVINPIKLNLLKNDTKNAKETKTLDESIDLSEIPEIIIIDDNDEEQSKSVQTSKSKTVEESSKSVPKIMVSSFAKCIDVDDDDSSTKKIKNNPSVAVNQAELESKATEDKNKIHGFIGVEYVVKICGDNIATRYDCGLCELNLAFDDMQKHLLGYSHRLKFCEKHFPTAIQQFRQYILDVPTDEHYKVMIPALQVLAEAIEKHHGRSQPFQCTQKRFKEERIRVLTEVFARAHASEEDGPTFTHVVNSKEIDDFVSKRHESIYQDKVVKEPIFDTINPQTKSQSNSTIPVVNRNINKIDNAPIVKMANAMRMHFKMSQPYHYEGPFPAHPYMEPQPYMGQQPYMHAQPYVNQQFAPPPPPQQHQQLFQPMPNFNRQPAVDDETHKRMVDKFLKSNNKDGSSSSTRSHRYDHHDRRDRNERHERNTHYRDSKRASRSPPRTSSSHTAATRRSRTSPDIWRSYCRLVDHKLKALDERFQQYRANPESHPAYNQEWQKFWQRRKAELVASGKDYRTYNYQPDWVLFFNNRIKELYDEAFEALKIESREELSLPLTNDFILETKYFIREKSTEGKKRDKSFEESQEVIDLEPPAKLKRTDSIQNANDIEKPSSSNSSVSIRIEDDETLTFVSVLRLLTALEEHLGSLGPKIVDLLAKALQAEKSSPAHGLALINEENCTILETAMEKFKGLLIAGILDGPKERALKKAIAKVAVFLEVAKKTIELVAKRTNTFQDETSRKAQLIEEKLAAALTAQGYTNFEREKLEQLAKVCMVLDKKKQEAVTAAASANILPISQNQTSAQKPLSDALSDIMGNFGSAGVTARRPNSNVSTEYQRASSSSASFPSSSSSLSSSLSSVFANQNSTNSVRNIGNSYNDNVYNSAMLQNNRGLNFEETTSLRLQQFRSQQQQQQQQQHLNYQQQNFQNNNWNQGGSNQIWNTNQRNSNYNSRTPMERGPYM